ncbi:MAG: transcriptional activator NhaR [Methylobacter sp.]|jgi:LysR family transcriptional activator of nhaA|nr:transcriptional activator NhaR [Methylobacter sp.]
MARINYQHLYYFWMVAKHGSISAACEELHLAQPTVSTQLAVFEHNIGSKLLKKQGRKLVLSETGQAVFHYADEIFSLGRELTHFLKGRNTKRGMRLNLGISDALPKLLAYRLIEPLLREPGNVQVQCWEDKTERLLNELALHSIDLVLSDVPATPACGTRVFNHFLGESPVAIFAAPDLAKRYRSNFPRCLNGASFLLPTSNTALRRSLDLWFDSLEISPNIQAEIEDSALIKTFGMGGSGLFFSPIAVAGAIEQQYRVEMIGLAEPVVERFYIVTAQRQLKHPLIHVILEQAQKGVFGLLGKS